jgi:hypothetical protein
VRVRIRHFVACASLLAVGCGAGQAEGASGADEAEEDPAAIELSVLDAEGQMYFVGDLRGSPVLLFLFATFDGVSQASLQPLSRIARRYPDLRVLAVAVQPNPRLLVDAYVHALEPPFPVTFDPDDTISTGRSMLGRVDTIPTFVALDRAGHEVARRVGFASERQLEAMVEEASVGQPPPTPRHEVPLLGDRHRH